MSLCAPSLLVLMKAFRIVELRGGQINIDGVDISKINLETLRTRLASTLR